MGGDSGMSVRQTKTPATQTIKTTLAPNFSTKICSGRKTCAMTPDQCSRFGFALSDEFQSCGKSAASRIPVSRRPAKPHHVIEASLIITIIQDFCRDDSCKSLPWRFWLDAIQGSGPPELAGYPSGG